MSGLSEVSIDDLLSFQDYPTVHSPSFNADSPSAPVPNTAPTQVSISNYEKGDVSDSTSKENIESASGSTKSFWTLEYYQQFFDVDTKDVVERIIASITPRNAYNFKNITKHKPDLYGPFWISVTLIFTIAISGNIANYLQHASAHYHWKYDFHLVSYAATAICIYVTVIPLALWGLLKWSSDITDLDGLEDGTTPSTIELICIYGYSLFIYIPVSILWTIQVNWLQWLLVLLAALLSGSVLLLTLMPALRLSRHKLFLIIGIISTHWLLAAGFMLYFFHVPKSSVSVVNVPQNITKM